MMYRTQRIPALMVLAVLFTTAASGSRQMTLRWSLESGQDLVYRATLTSETEMPGGQGMILSENIQTIRWEVTDVSAAGDATVRMTTERVQMKMSSPMANVEADSASEEPTTDPTAAMMTAMAGTSYTLVVSPSGEIKDLRGLDEMRAAVRAAAPPGTAAMLDQMLESNLGDESIRSMFQQSFQSFPDRPLDPGDSWDVSVTMPLPLVGTMTTSMTLTLDRIEDRDGSSIAVIHNRGTIVTSPDGQAEGPLAGMMEMGDAATTGTIEWDIDRGVLLKNTTSTTMEMTMSTSGQPIVMGVVTDMTMELVEDGG